VPLLVSDFAEVLLVVGPEAPPPPAGEELPVEELWSELVGATTGALTAGVVAGTTLTVELGNTVPAAAVLTELCASAWPDARAGARSTFTAGLRISGALLKASGIAAPADSAGRLAGNRSAGVPSCLSARPIAKQHPNTRTPANPAIATVRAVMLLPATLVGAVGIRKLFMTGTLSACSLPG
jgi:hypothetical protein